MIRNVPQPIISAINGWLRSNGQGDVTSFNFSTGGCINSTGRISAGGESFFLKWNNADEYPGMLQAEARGLRLLTSNAVDLSIPVPLDQGEAESYQYLLLTFINSSQKSKNYWSDLGRGLALLHRVTGEKFGLDHDNWIGSLPQHNNPSSSWTGFFKEQRLLPQLDLAIRKGLIDNATARQMEGLMKRLDDLLRCEVPSLLHGDLWSGNIMANERGRPALIDPAIYFGHREAELAMTKLFGGFDADFYGSYHSEYPLEPGYEERFDIYNLYPLLVHVNLFGSAYLSQIRRILIRYQ